MSQLACVESPPPEPNLMPEDLSSAQSRRGDVIESGGKKEGRKKVRFADELPPNNPIEPRSSEEDFELNFVKDAIVVSQ